MHDVGADLSDEGANLRNGLQRPYGSHQLQRVGEDLHLGQTPPQVVATTEGDHTRVEARAREAAQDGRHLLTEVVRGERAHDVQDARSIHRHMGG